MTKNQFLVNKGTNTRPPATMCNMNISSYHNKNLKLTTEVNGNFIQKITFLNNVFILTQNKMIPTTTCL